MPSAVAMVFGRAGGMALGVTDEPIAARAAGPIFIDETRLDCLPRLARR
jgi:hypothetical protein